MHLRAVELSHIHYRLSRGSILIAELIHLLCLLATATVSVMLFLAEDVKIMSGVVVSVTAGLQAWMAFAKYEEKGKAHLAAGDAFRDIAEKGEGIFISTDETFKV